MRKICWILLLFVSMAVYAQQTGTVTGTVYNDYGQPVSGVSVTLDGQTAVTDANGQFTFEGISDGEHQLSYNLAGIEPVNEIVNVSNGAAEVEYIIYGANTVLLNETIVTASKKPQKITEVPATVNVITAQDIEEFPSFNIGELAARQKGVDFVRAGVLGTGLNIRGFNSAFNTKNLQVTDDRISMLVATGLPYGTFSTVTKDDIERVEILLGPNGTLYGPNAHNGLVSTITKNPRRSEGTTVALGAGNQSVLTGRLRHAQVLNDKWAYKLHFEHSQGEEFDYVDSVYYNGVGYGEKNLDRDFNSTKYGGAIHFNPTRNSEIIGYYGHSNNSNLGVTNAGRNQINDWTIDVAQLKYVSRNIFLNTYYSWSRTDNTYSINQRTQNYLSFVQNGFSEAESWERSLYEQWFPAFGISLNRTALFQDKSRRFNAEGQYNNTWGDFTFIGGVQYQLDMANSNGTYLMDQDGAIDIAQTGIYTQLEYALPDAGMKFLFGARVDNHDQYGTNFIPKAAITKNVGNGTFRVTYGHGIAVPSIMNLQGKLFGGMVLGNGEGFTLSDGSTVNRLEVETIDSFEAGYKGQLSESLYIDANAYYNMSKNFISPLRLITNPVTGVGVTHVGDTPVGQVIAGVDNATTVLTYLNFGKVDTYGFDIGLNYYWTNNWRTSLNYSYFGRKLDKNDMANDGNLDGVVTETDLPINTPENKLSLGVHFSNRKFYGSLFGRWVQKYDFFSGINVAAETQDLNGDGTMDIIENAKNGTSWNYGQLGGFIVDANAGYSFNNGLSIGANVTNLFNNDVREFVASPVVGTLFSLELKYNFNLFADKD